MSCIINEIVKSNILVFSNLVFIVSLSQVSDVTESDDGRREKGPGKD